MRHDLSGTCHCGAVTWAFESTPTSATACNCTVCRKYGVLWIYGRDNEGVTLSGPTTSYRRKDGNYLEFLFCPTCGCCAAWRARQADADGGKTIAVNLRLIDDPSVIMDLPVRHFEGLETFKPVENRGGTIRDLWF